MQLFENQQKWKSQKIIAIFIPEFEKMYVA